jgi:cell division protein FtsQ
VLAVLAAAALSLQATARGESWSERLGHVIAAAGLRVQEVRIEGRQKTQEALLRAAIGVVPGEPILGYSLSAARQRIESIPWVQSATVERRLPSTVVVQLVERRPFAVWQHDGKFVLIDRAGRMVTDSDVATFAGQLPLVVGAGAPEAAARLLDALAAQPTVQTHVTAAVRVGERRWNLQLATGAQVLLPEDAEVPALAKLAELQKEFDLLDRPLAVVDLRLPDRFSVRPKAEGASGTAADNKADARDGHGAQPATRRPT